MKKICSLLVIAIVAVFIFSCEKDFNEIGGNLIDQTNFQVSQVDQSLLSVKTDQVFFHSTSGTASPFPVQTDNLSYNLLGYYNDPIYGITTNNVVSKVALNAYGTTFNSSAEIEEVILSVPYYSRRVSTDSDGEGTYELDSVYGGSPIRLSIFRSHYFLNDYAPGDNGNFDEEQLYFSNDASLIESNYSPTNDLLLSIDPFYPSNLEVDVQELNESTGEMETVERLSPRIRANLDINDFQWLIDATNSSNLENVSAFQDFYRGIYFKAEALNSNEGVLLGLDLSQASIEISFKQEEQDDNGDPVLDGNGDPKMVTGTITMGFVEKSVTFFENNFNVTPSTDRIYLKGGEGAMATINLFGDEDPANEGVFPELETLKTMAGDENWLINEANLQFYVDNTQAANADSEPERIMIFDVDNNRVLLDYLFDGTTGTDANDVKTKHLGRLERDDTGRGVKYKVNLTEHINSLIKLDSTNIKLGLMLSNNVSLLGNSVVNNTEDSEGNFDTVLSSSLVSHRGTVLYNENETDEDKKLKLKIYYTKED